MDKGYKEDDEEEKMPSSQKPPAKPPRRQSAFRTDEAEGSDEKPSSNNPTVVQEASKAEPEEILAGPKGGRRRSTEMEKPGGGGGGWMTVQEKKTTKTSVEEVEEEPVQTSTTNKDKHFQDNDEIVVIPDLDEDGGDSDQRIARAPRNITRKIPTLADLESEVKAAIPQSEGGFDLSVLLNTLVPPQQVQEGDEHWTFESLLRDVTDELMVPTKTVLEATVLPQSPTSPVPADRNKSKEKKK